MLVLKGATYVVRVPVQTPVHHWKCLKWVLEFQNWVIGQWKEITCSNESSCLLLYVDAHMCLCQLPGEEIAPGCTASRGSGEKPVDAV